MRIKKVELVALGLTAPLNLTTTPLDGAVEFEESLNRNSPAVAALTVQPDAAPRLVGWAVSDDELAEKPVGKTQVPLAVVQAANPADLIAVADGTLKSNS